MAVKTFIHVNGHNLRMNKRDHGNRPVFTAKDYKHNRKGNFVKIHGPSELEYFPGTGTPHKSGAVAAIITYSDVDIW